MKELFPGKFKPTDTHRFIKLLADRKVLLRCYTQNIDGLEQIAGVPANLILQAHGGFDSAHCIDCKKMQDIEEVKTSCLKGEVHHCFECGGLVKPDIVFFGEALPSDFAHCVETDFPKCDCLIVLGTSLSVFPFAGLVGRVRDDTPRILINREMCGNNAHIPKRFLFNEPTNTRDVFVQSDCDTAARSMMNIIASLPPTPSD